MSRHVSKIILISGATATGKSKIALKIANKINGEIINADSMQIYKQIKILNARPGKKDNVKIKHHLYGFQDVKNNFSTGHWLKLAVNKIKEIRKKNKTPILVGGTGLYFKSLTHGFVKIPNVPKKFRAKIIKIHNKIGQNRFYKKLIKIDKKSVNKIDPNDTHRTLRAYEVIKYTNKSLFDWIMQTKKKFKNDEFVKIRIEFPRENIIERINKRTEKMFKSGVVNEVKNFLKLNVKKDASSSKIIGISEISDYLSKKESLFSTKEKISIKTRQYAKRQATWARGYMKDWHKVHNPKLKNFLKIINTGS